MRFCCLSCGTASPPVTGPMGTRRVWHDVLAEGFSLGLHRIERLNWENAMRARPRRHCLPPDTCQRMVSAVAPKAMNYAFKAVKSVLFAAKGDFK